MFNNLRQGSQVWVLEKGDKLTLTLASVTGVSQALPKYNVQTPNAAIGIQPEMVIDVKINVDGSDIELKQMPCNATIEHRGNYVIAESRDAMLGEVDTLRTNAQKVLDSVEYNQQVLDATDEMLKTLNPSYAKEQERDAAIEKLRGDMGNLNNCLDEITNLLTKALSRSNK